MVKGREHLIMYRDGKFCEPFRDILSAAGVKAVRLPVGSNYSGGLQLATNAGLAEPDDG